MIKIKIGKVYGIEIKLHLSTLLIIGLVGFYAANFYASVVDASLIELILVGILNGLIILCSILLHELAHSIVAQKYGLKVREIELYLFGGASKIEEEPRTPKSEIIISAVGPLSSLLIGGILLLILFAVPVSLPPVIIITLFYSGISNIGLGIFNLIPAFPIDGGRILRAILWFKRKSLISATKTASKIGSYIAYGLMVYGFIQILLFGIFNGLWLIIIGSFLNNQTKQSYIQVLNEEMLSHLNAKDMISLPRLEIPFDLTISEAIDQFFMVYRKSYFPVTKNGIIVGIIHIDDVKKIPFNQRTELIVGYAMKSLKSFPSIYDNDSGKQVMRKIIDMNNKPQLVVVKEHGDEFVLGFIGKEDIASSLRFCKLNPDKCQ